MTDAFDLPTPRLILVGAGAQSLPGHLPGHLPARAAFCSPLTQLRLTVAEQRAIIFGVPVYFVSAARGLVAPDERIIGGEMLLIDQDLIKETTELLIRQLDNHNTSIVELHASPQVAALVAAALKASGEPHLLTAPRIHTNALSEVFRVYKEACK